MRPTPSREERDGCSAATRPTESSSSSSAVTDRHVAEVDKAGGVKEREVLKVLVAAPHSRARPTPPIRPCGPDRRRRRGVSRSGSMPGRRSCVPSTWRSSWTATGAGPAARPRPARRPRRRRREDPAGSSGYAPARCGGASRCTPSAGRTGLAPTTRWWPLPPARAGDPRRDAQLRPAGGAGPPPGRLDELPDDLRRLDPEALAAAEGGDRLRRSRWRSTAPATRSWSTRIPAIVAEGLIPDEVDEAAIAAGSRPACRSRPRDPDQQRTAALVS